MSQLLNIGSQTPRLLTHPYYLSSSGAEVVEYCASVGLTLDPWQQLILQHGLAENPINPRKWAAFEVGFTVARQNGKGEVLMAREVAGLFLLGERLILHSAHEFRTSREAFLRIVSLVTNNDSLRRRVKSVRQTNGEEGIELTNGARLRFLARSTSSGRGFTGDCIILDEAQILGDGPIRAMLPTLSARPNPQLWLAGTAGNQQSTHLAAIRRRAFTGGDPSLTYLEWSVDEDAIYDPADPAQWAVANPALGIRISAEYISRERAAMSPEGFASERLGIGDWPSDQFGGVIAADIWNACADPDAERPIDPLVLAVDVDPHRTAGAIAVAGGGQEEGHIAVEIADTQPGLDWLLPRITELVDQWQPVAVVIDRAGPAGTLVDPLEALGVTVLVPTSQEVAQAAEGFYDKVLDGTLRHRADPRLDVAVAGAKQRPIGDAWGWARRTSSTNISPLVAASFAVWGYATQSADYAQPSIWVI